MKLDAQLIGYITTFEHVTKANVKDCFFGRDGVLIFIIPIDELGKAIGKKGANVKILSQKLKKKLRIIGFDTNPLKFAQNILFPLKGFEIREEDQKIVIVSDDISLKGKIIGRNKENLKHNNELLQRYFKGYEIVVE